MNPRDRALCLIYGALTIADLLIMTVIGVVFVLGNFHDGFAGLIADFVRDALSSSAGWFVYGDLTITWIALSVFMVFEARRLGIRFVWAYIVAAPVTALSVSLPAFMLARQLKLAAAREELRMTKYDDVLTRAADHLLSRQRAEGYWYEPMYSDAGLEAADLFGHELLGTRTEEITTGTARWIRHRQGSDGSWAVYPGGPGSLSITVEAYVALRLAGDDPSLPHMDKAAAFCRQQGGAAKARTGTKVWLALLGLMPWKDLPAMMPEQLLVPAGSALSIYGFAAWTRTALVPLAIISAHQPVHPVPFTVPELSDTAPPPRKRAAAIADGAMQFYQRHPVPGPRRAALRAAEQWLLRHQQPDCSWYGIHLMTIFGALALQTLGYRPDHPSLRGAIERLHAFGVAEQLPSGPARRVAECPGAVWDTALAVTALSDSGLPASHDALTRAADWLLGQEARHPGDWALKRPGLAPGGWAFCTDANLNPDCDDTAMVLTALQRVDSQRTGAGTSAPGRDLGTARDRGTAWLLGMQTAEGGWAAYDAGPVQRLSRLIAELPFNDFGPVIDPPWGGDITGHVLEALPGQGLAGSPQARRAVDWLLGVQEPDGSWYGRWGVHYVYGTAAAVVGIQAATPDDPRAAAAAQKGVRWLLDHQNADGGWGEDCRAYDDPGRRGQGESTPSQTAWALLALHAAGVPADRPETARALDWLAASQREDGSWPEDVCTATGHPGELFFGQPMYPRAFPLMAIARYR